MPIAESTITTQQYLTLMLDDVYFAVNILNVKEILEYIKITKMPDAPDFMCGIINVRGSVIPVVDLRMKLGMGLLEQKATTRIIIMEIEKEGAVLSVGYLTDSVKEVIEIAPEQVDPPPDIGTRWTKDYIIGVGKYNNEFIMLLDINKIFIQSELKAFDLIDSGSTSLTEGATSDVEVTQSFG